MDLSNMTPKDKGRYEVAAEAGSAFIQDLRQRVVPEDFEDIIYMIRRAEYKRGKADGIAESKPYAQKDNYVIKNDNIVTKRGAQSD